MFVDNMSSDELLYEYNMDLPDIQAQTMRYDRSDYITNHLWKNRKKSKVVVSKHFVSSRKNHYIGIIIYTQSGIGQSRRWEWSSFHIGLMHTFKGLSAVAFYTDSQQAVKFTPHFFKRYKERFSKVCDWRTHNQLMAAKSIEDILPIYIKRNLGTTWIETKSVFRDKMHIFAPVNDGVALIQWDKTKKLLQANTFVTLDMLDAKQTKMVDYAKAYFSLSEKERHKYKFPDFITGDDSSSIKNQ